MKTKTFFAVLTAVFCMIFATACGDSPSDVVTQFTDAMSEADFDKAAEFTTGDAKQGIEMIGMLMMMAKDEKDIAKIKNEFAAMKATVIEGEEINGDTATVKCSIVKDGKKSDGTIKLKKVDGDWKIFDAGN